MKKSIIVWMGALLMLAFVGCSSDEEVEATSYDATYQVSFYNQDPGLNTKQGHWEGDVYIEFSPQSEPPYNLLVQWSDEKGKQAIDYVLEKNSDVMTKLAEIPENNEYRISSKMYFESPYFYISSAYKSSEKGRGGVYSIFILPQILIKMKEGKSVEAIEKEYTHVLTLLQDDNLYNMGVYTFDSNVKTSREALRLAAEIHQRNDVEWAETNMYGGFSGCFSKFSGCFSISTE